MTRFSPLPLFVSFLVFFASSTAFAGWTNDFWGDWMDDKENMAWDHSSWKDHGHDSWKDEEHESETDEEHDSEKDEEHDSEKDEEHDSEKDEEHDSEKDIEHWQQHSDDWQEHHDDWKSHRDHRKEDWQAWWEEKESSDEGNEWPHHWNDHGSSDIWEDWESWLEEHKASDDHQQWNETEQAWHEKEQAWHEEDQIWHDENGPSWEHTGWRHGRWWWKGKHDNEDHHDEMDEPSDTMTDETELLLSITDLGSTTTQNPEPSSIVLAIIALLGLLGYGWHRRNR